MKENKMKVVAVHEYLLFKEAINPFLKMKTDSGIILMPGIADSKETGDIESLDQIVGFGLVEAIGDECKYVKVGDGIFYDRRSVRAVPLKETLWQYQERNIIAIVPQEDDTLQIAYAEYYKEQAEMQELQMAYEQKLEAARKERLSELQRKLDSGEIKLKETGPLIKVNYGNNR